MTVSAKKANETCTMATDTAGLSWDAICFICLIFMLRVFKSWYFQHVVFELKIATKLMER